MIAESLTPVRLLNRAALVAALSASSQFAPSTDPIPKSRLARLARLRAALINSFSSPEISRPEAAQYFLIAATCTLIVPGASPLFREL